MACVFYTNACWMAVSVMADNCGLNSWESNSEILLARSSNPEGPYEPFQVLLSPFAHNPTMHVLPNSSIIIAHIGGGVPSKPLITNCSNGTTPGGGQISHSSSPDVESADAPRFGVPGTVLPPPNFLFLPSGMPGDGTDWVIVNSSSIWAMNNPALYIDPNDGGVTLIYKTGCACPPPCTFCRQFGIASAPEWRGPYTDLGLIPVYGEDAYIWRDPVGAAGGGWHMLFQGGSYSPIYPQYVGHWHTAYSPDGVHNWTVERFSNAFNATIPLQSGGAVQLNRRERSQVVFDAATGAPAFLFNGATPASPDGDHSFTTVQPVLSL